MFEQTRVSGDLSFAAESETMSLLAERIRPLFEPAPPPDAGLYVASTNAGFQSAVRFWSEARRTGLAVASPELFPWTLANAPCGWLARHFRVTGPTFTFSGGSDAAASALTQAEDDLRCGRVRCAWVITLDFAQNPPERTTFSALRLSLRPDGG
jgi:3-oxoacyl-(acyl-carrier-protein) synthase